MTSKPRRLFLSPPHLSGTELRLVEEAFASNYIAPTGPMVDALEREFAETTGFRHATAVTSGTAALHLGLRGLGVGPGDEVLAASLTFIGGIGPIVYQGAAPVFMDVDPATWTLDVRMLEEELAASARRGRLPKVLLPTDLYGQSCDLDAILEVARPYGVPVLCDSAEAVGTTYKGRHAGVGARAAAFSFNGNKIITGSGGGILAADDRQLIERARMLSQQAREPVPHYEHLEIGFNYRMSNIVAAICRGQLCSLADRVARRRLVFEGYRERLAGLPGLSFMPEAPYGRATRWLTVIVIEPEAFGCDRERVRVELEEANIEARPIWKPMHLQPVFKGARRIGGEVSERLFENGLCLPSGSAMTSADLDRVATIVTRCCLT